MVCHSVLELRDWKLEGEAVGNTRLRLLLWVICHLVELLLLLDVQFVLLE